MQTGPLIPGLREYDAPRRPRRGPLRWVVPLLLGVAVVTVLAGIFGGVGPLRALGVDESPLQPVAWRPTTEARQIQVAVALSTRLCAGDEVRVVPVEGGDQIVVEASRLRSKSAAGCSSFGIGGDRTWVDVTLDAPVGQRTLIRRTDRQPLQRENVVTAQ